MPIVDIKGVGKAQFPDGMSVDNIRSFLRNKYATGNESSLLQPAPQTIEAYEPSLVEKFGSGIGDALTSTGLISDNYGAQRIGRNIASIGEFLPGIGDATAGDEFGRALAQGDYGGAVLAGAGAVPILGDMAIFAGVLAKNADLGALRKAKMLEDTGADRDKIWKETGWANDKGDWKFEIDDSKSVFDISDEAMAYKKLDLDFALASDAEGAAKYSKSNELEDELISKYGKDYSSNWDAVPEAEQEAYFASLNDIPDTIGDILWDMDTIKSGNLTGRDIKPNTFSSLGNALLHDELYSNYPSARGIDLQHNTSGKIATEASYSPRFDKISIGDPTYSKIKSPVTHELQHAIQKREGFAKGGRVDQFELTPDLIKESLDTWGNVSLLKRFSEAKGEGVAIKRFEQLFERKPTDMELSLAKKTSFDRIAQSQRELKQTPFESYQRLAGEAEARNVQKRMDWTAEQRRDTPPWETLDVPESELIYRK